MVKVYLSRKGISYEEKNVSLDAGAREEVIAMGHRTTPVTTIGEHKVVGYNTTKLDEALAAEGLV